VNQRINLCETYLYNRDPIELAQLRPDQAVDIECLARNAYFALELLARRHHPIPRRPMRRSPVLRDNRCTGSSATRTDRQ